MQHRGFSKAFLFVRGARSFARSRGQLFKWFSLVISKEDIAPEFFPEKVKGMISLMIEAATSLVNSWEDTVTKSGGIAAITVDEDVRNMSADVISKTAFGSSYSKGKEIFSKLRELQQLMGKALLVGIPFSSYIPTKNNREKEIREGDQFDDIEGCQRTDGSRT